MPFARDLLQRSGAQNIFNQFMLCVLYLLRKLTFSLKKREITLF